MLKRFLRKTELYKQVFNSNAGKQVLEFLAEECGQFRSSFVQGDPQATAFNEGKRAIFNHILHVCDIDEGQIRKAIKDEQDRMRDENDLYTQ